MPDAQNGYCFWAVINAINYPVTSLPDAAQACAPVFSTPLGLARSCLSARYIVIPSPLRGEGRVRVSFIVPSFRKVDLPERSRFG